MPSKKVKPSKASSKLNSPDGNKEEAEKSTVALSNPSSPLVNKEAKKYSIDKDDYLKEIIVLNPKDKTKYICLLCTENTSDLKDLSGLKTPHESAKLLSLLKDVEDINKLTTLNIFWLRRHLETKSHIGFTKAEDQPRLQKAVKALTSPHARNITNDIMRTPLGLDSDPSDEDSEPEILPLSKHMEGSLYLDLCNLLIQNHIPYDVAPVILQFVQYVNENYHGELVQRSHISATTAKKIIRDCIC